MAWRLTKVHEMRYFSSDNLTHWLISTQVEF